MFTIHRRKVEEVSFEIQVKNVRNMYCLKGIYAIIRNVSECILKHCALHFSTLIILGKKMIWIIGQKGIKTFLKWRMWIGVVIFHQHNFKLNLWSLRVFFLLELMFNRKYRLFAFNLSMKSRVDTMSQRLWSLEFSDSWAVVK